MLNLRELSTVLAALRAYQAPHTHNETQVIATNGGTLEPLTNDEIDELCERINVEPEQSGKQSWEPVLVKNLLDAADEVLSCAADTGADTNEETDEMWPDFDALSQSYSALRPDHDDESQP